MCLSLGYNSHRRPTASRFAIAAKNVDGFTGTFGDLKTLSISRAHTGVNLDPLLLLGDLGVQAREPLVQC